MSWTAAHFKGVDLNSILDELRNYSPSAILGMAWSFVWTKLFFTGANLIRKPFYLRGSKRNLQYGKGFTTGRGCRIELFEDGVIRFGDRCHIGDFVHIVSSSNVEIGNDCLFASKIFISDTSHGSYGVDGDSPEIPPNDRELASSFVRIGDNVWLGDNVVIMPGITIGDGCVIGASAVVTKDIPEGSIVGGCPAKVLKRWNSKTKQWERA